MATKASNGLDGVLAALNSAKIDKRLASIIETQINEAQALSKIPKNELKALKLEARGLRRGIELEFEVKEKVRVYSTWEGEYDYRPWLESDYVGGLNGDRFASRKYLEEHHKDALDKVVAYEKNVKAFKDKINQLAKEKGIDKETMWSLINQGG